MEYQVSIPRSSQSQTSGFNLSTNSSERLWVTASAAVLLGLNLLYHIALKYYQERRG